jgi:hypothetical protein
MNLPYQSPSIDRTDRMGNAIAHGVDPAIFGLDWDDIRGGVGSVMSYLAPHAATAAKQFAVDAIEGL